MFPEEEGDKWIQIRDDIKRSIKEHPLLKNDKARRMLIYDNLNALSRVSFRTAFEMMCDFYSVDLQGFWPVTGNAKGWSLSIIRNKLVHGEHFNPAQIHALMAAHEHLRWIVERLILAILGWDVAKSSVNTNYLAQRMFIYQDWQADQRLLSDSN